MPAIILATRNKGKIAELTAMLRRAVPELEVKGLDSFPDIGELPEEGDTFEENARSKACTAARLTGMVAVADDSGLEVDALGGRPGVYSARYSADVPGAEHCTGKERDQQNNLKLLRELEDVAQEKRTARFRCVMAGCTPTGETITASGAWEGRIGFAPEGENGFGYDPLFFDAEAECTSAQLTAAEKNAKSHRGKALAALLEAWPAFWNKAAQKGAA